MNTTLTFTKFDKVKTKLPGGQMAFFVMIMFGFRMSLEEAHFLKLENIISVDI